MAEVFVKPYVPDQQSVDQLYYPSYLPTELNYSQYASLHPDVSDIVDQPALPIETRYDPWEAVAAQVRKKYPQQERPIPLLGTGGAERYQTWPERTIRSALTLPVETYQGTVQSGPGLRREDVTDIPGQAQPLDPLMERAQDVAGLAGGTMFAGVPKGAATLGAGPIRLYRGEYSGNKGGKFWSTDPEFARQFTQSGLESEVKTKTIKPEEIYKADHVYAGDPDAIDKVLLEAKKGGFKAVELNEGQGQPNSILFLSETSKVGAPLSALEKAPMFYSAVENAVKASKQNVATKEQWLSYLKNQQGVKPEEMQWTGLDNLPEGKITKQQLEQHIAENKVQFNEVWKGKFNKDVPLKAIKTDGGYWEIRNEQGQFLTNVLENVSEQEALNIAKQRLESNDPAKIQRDETKFSQYSLPGGERYRELLLQLPIKSGPEGNAVANFAKQMREKYGERWISEASSVEMRRYDDLINAQEKAIDKPELSNFKSDHWDEPNVLAHIRMNDREIPDVGKSLHIEEIQSDWHQKGRKEGYKVSEAEKNRMTKELQDIQKERAELVSNDKPYVVGQFESRYAELNQKEADLTDRYNALVHDAVPDAPFKKTWDELVIKRVIRQAVEEGKDAISWTPGEAQAARYDLSKHVDYIHYDPKDGSLWAGKGMNRVLNEENVKPNELEKYIGKEAADKIVNNPTEKQGDIHVLSGEKLKVGGEGMKGFYDKMMVDKVNNLAKKYGGKVEQKEIKSGGKPSDEIELPEGRPLEVVKKENGSYTIKLEGSDNTWGLFGREIWAKERLKVLQKAWDEGRQPIHVLKLTPELKEAALTKGFALFSETSKVGAPLSALEKSGMTPEIKSRIVPAIKNYETGKIETVSRGKSHEELMMNYHQKSKGNPNASYMDIVNNGLKNNETGYYDPKTKQFYNRDSVSDLESTELMTPTQLKKYEQNKVLWSSGLQFPKPLEQPSFNERWNERIPADMSVEERKGIQPFPTNYTPPERFLEKRPVRLTKVDYDPFTK